METAPHTRASLVACPQCDLLHHQAPLPTGSTALCRRCGAVLGKTTADSIERTLAWTLSAACLFVIANSLPLVALEAQGVTLSTTVLGTVQSLYSTDQAFIAALVFITTLLLPAIEIGAMLYLLLPLLGGRVPLGVGLVYRAVRALKPWVMIEVFMLGTLVSLARLSHMASVIPGLALWSFGALMIAMAAASAVFQPRAMWRQIALLKREPA